VTKSGFQIARLGGYSLTARGLPIPLRRAPLSLVDLQHRNTIDFAGVLGLRSAAGSATAAATGRVAQQRTPKERAAPGEEMPALPCTRGLVGDQKNQAGRDPNRATVSELSYCPGNGGILTLATFGTGTAPAFGEVAEQFVPLLVKPTIFPVSRAVEISLACTA
jgi:hypothetical protein